MSYTEISNNIIINKLSLNKYKELKTNNQLVANEIYVIEDYLGDYTYICTGSNDNVAISNIVKAFLNGGTDYKLMKLNVVGNLGVTLPCSGDGSSNTPYAWFDFNVTCNRRVHIDFSNCGQITIPAITGGINAVFACRDLILTNANIVANNTNSNSIIRMFYYSSSKIYCENCRFWINAYKESLISYTGTFVNCRGSVMNVTGNTSCFATANSGLTRIIGGEYYAYTGSTSGYSAIVAQSGENSISILYGVNAPKLARDTYYQTNSIKQYAGWVNCTDLVSELALAVVTGKSNIRGTIALSKPNLM